MRRPTETGASGASSSPVRMGAWASGRSGAWPAGGDHACQPVVARARRRRRARPFHPQSVASATRPPTTLVRMARRSQRCRIPLIDGQNASATVPDGSTATAPDVIRRRAAGRGPGAPGADPADRLISTRSTLATHGRLHPQAVTTTVDRVPPPAADPGPDLFDAAQRARPSGHRGRPGDRVPAPQPARGGRGRRWRCSCDERCPDDARRWRRIPARWTIRRRRQIISSAEDIRSRLRDRTRVRSKVRALEDRGRRGGGGAAQGPVGSSSPSCRPGERAATRVPRGIGRRSPTRAGQWQLVVKGRQEGALGSSSCSSAEGSSRCSMRCRASRPERRCLVFEPKTRRRQRDLVTTLLAHWSAPVNPDDDWRHRRRRACLRCS